MEWELLLICLGHPLLCGKEMKLKEREKRWRSIWGKKEENYKGKRDVSRVMMGQFGIMATRPHQNSSWH